MCVCVLSRSCLSTVCTLLCHECLGLKCEIAVLFVSSVCPPLTFGTLFFNTYVENGRCVCVRLAAETACVQFIVRAQSVISI